MKRTSPILLVLAGWILAQVIGSPQQVYSQGRTSLASLQNAINSIINGNTTVGNAANAESLDGISAAEVVVLTDLFPLEDQIITLDARVSEIEDTAAFHGQSIQIGDTANEANASNAGTIRFKDGMLQVSDGTAWRIISLENNDF